MGSPASFATERDGGSVAPLSRGSWLKEAARDAVS